MKRPEKAAWNHRSSRGPGLVKTTLIDKSGQQKRNLAGAEVAAKAMTACTKKSHDKKLKCYSE